MLPHFAAKYRFFFSPVRYTSPELTFAKRCWSACPSINLATTEMGNIDENGVSGYTDMNVDALVPYTWTNDWPIPGWPDV